MALNITRITITGLHGNLNIEIPIRDNKLVLVGVNGLGKTTALNVTYYFLTRQWQKLKQITFDEIAITFGSKGKRMAVTRTELISSAGETLNKIIRHRFAPSIASRIAKNQELSLALMEPDISEETIRRLSVALTVSTSVIRSIRHTLLNSADMFGVVSPDVLQAVRKLHEFLDEEVTDTVLYLPTYRRIEQDLRTVFPHMEEELHKHMDPGKVRPRARNEYGHIELVQFGMEDVVSQLLQLRNELREQARTELNNLTGSYLRDIIRNEATTYDKSEIANLSADDVQKILARVEERSLGEGDKKELHAVIRKLQSGGPKTRISLREKYLAHFFSKLVGIYKLQQEKETRIREFAKIANTYLVGKSLKYEEVSYSVTCQLDSGDNVELKDLSSGEKQIVSLFAHLHLSDDKRFMVIIDEPELSLSVDWQLKLLPDILASERCSFLMAVTHSPFIFDNELDSYAVDMRSCIRAG